MKVVAASLPSDIKKTSSASPPWKVIPYSTIRLKHLLASPQTSVAAVGKKDILKFFTDYLGKGGIRAKTILVEPQYTSKDYLLDYTNYYSRCFKDYKKTCTRLHFFSNKFSAKDFQQVLAGTKSQPKFWDHYLGFIVVKPIPLTMIGSTLLKHYEETNGRTYWGKRDYVVNVFGHSVKIKSLIFQEQDTVTAACATTSIWSMLSKANAVHQTPLKTPFEITSDAAVVSTVGGRVFPNKDGLDINQITEAIQKSGLVTEIAQPDINLNLDKHRHKFPEEYIKFLQNQEYMTNNTLKVFSNRYLKKLINAYSSIGVPPILTIYVADKNGYDLHAMAVSGHNKNPHEFLPHAPAASWSADSIDTFYAHDDQWGPFSRNYFKDQWKIFNNWSIFHKQHFPSYTSQLVIPLYDKIRITYGEIEELVEAMDGILTEVCLEQFHDLDFTWDIKLENSNDYKAGLRTSLIDRKALLRELTDPYPRFIWVATCYIGVYKMLDLVFDATAVSHDMIGKTIVMHLFDRWYQKYIYQKLSSNRMLASRYLGKQGLSKDYYHFLLENFSKKV